MIERVRSLPPEQGGAIPASAITAHGDEHSPDRTLAAGFQVHVRKPMDPSDLCRALTGIIRRG